MTGSFDPWRTGDRFKRRVPPTFTVAAASGATYVDGVLTQSNLTATLPTNTTNDILYAFCYMDIGSSAWGSAPTGWTADVASTGTGADGGQFATYYKVSSGSETDPTFTNTNSSESDIIIVSIRGANTTTPLTFTTPTNVTTNQTSPVSASATGGTAASGDIVVVFWLGDLSSPVATSKTVPTGFTNILDSAHTWNWVAADYKEGYSAGATGNVDTTITSSASLGWAGIVVCFNAA